MLWFRILRVWLAFDSKSKLECTCGCRCRCGVIIMMMSACGCGWTEDQWPENYLHAYMDVCGDCALCTSSKLTCSCDPLGSPAARRQPWPGPVVRKRGSTLAACRTGWPRHLARRTRSPSMSSMPATPGEMVQTGRHPAGSLSPG